MVAGVETGEHPPSSLEGVEQPSEASGGEKLRVVFTSQTGITAWENLLSAAQTAIPTVCHP